MEASPAASFACSASVICLAVTGLAPDFDEEAEAEEEGFRDVDVDAMREGGAAGEEAEEAEGSMFFTSWMTLHWSGVFIAALREGHLNFLK